MLTKVNAVKILVIDDEQSIVDSFVCYFSKKGYSIKGISMPEDTLIVLGEEAFDVVITDLHMSPITGFELIDIVRYRYPQTLIIAMSGKYNRYDVMDLDIDYFFEKPFLFKEIEGIIKEKMALSKSRD